MSYLDQITVGSTTYDIQDSTAAASLAVDGSTLFLKDRNNSTLSSATLPSGLPAVTSSDDGKVLTVASGTWSAAEVEALPTVTSADDGKFLGVSSGSWGIVDDISEFYYGTTEPTDPDIKFWMNPAGMNMVHEVPPYGAPGQILAKTSSDSYLIDWIDIPTISTSDIDTIMEG